MVPDETKFAIADGASRGSALSETLRMVGHHGLLLALSLPFVDHFLFTEALVIPALLLATRDRLSWCAITFALVPAYCTQSSVKGR
jgi:hypothetical protein